LNPVAVALDLPTLDEARALAVLLRGAVGMVKVGLELFVRSGPDAMIVGRDADAPVFLDLKLHDIPETVERAVARAAELGARVLTVHASGGPKMLRVAVARAAKENPALRIAAVTVLTSLDESDLTALGWPKDRSVRDVASTWATMAFAEGVTSFVCSVHEVEDLRRTLGPNVFLITPGIRPTAGPVDDQKRVATPAAAIRLGASLLVVGRPVRDAVDPKHAAERIAREAMDARTSMPSTSPNEGTRS